MQVLAAKHFGTKFVKADVETVPFFVNKLKVQVLPCLVLFMDGIVVDRSAWPSPSKSALFFSFLSSPLLSLNLLIRVVGFEELGGKDDFSTQLLEKRLAKSGLVHLLLLFIIIIIIFFFFSIFFPLFLIC